MTAETSSPAYTPIPLPDYQEKPLDQMRADAQAFYDEIRTRHTIREFSDRPVPRDIIETCLKAAGTAPSGANHQPWHFSVIGDASMKRKIRLAAEEEERAFYAGRAGDEWIKALAPLGTDDSKPFLEIAPWLICIFGERKSRSTDGEMRKNYYVPESVSIATGFLLAALHRAGLATLTHTPNPMSFLSEICGRPAHDKPYILLVTGYPAQNATIPQHATLKRDLADIATFY
ncbi:nitroreductase family protein [Thalassospira marina]|uniref:Nitroreductase family protein n=1 Tax=Thalassospira marina TaxID=2048283 RepID=A0ABN5FGX5_9PROT|nr:nitroreductase family protein [Thalassospira marina]AUG53982.1 nitroreductase family protein [Thalassospira marina]